MSILVLGGNGLVGSAVKRHLSNTNRPFIVASRQDADLQDFQQTNAFFQKVSPKVNLLNVVSIRSQGKTALQRCN